MLFLLLSMLLLLSLSLLPVPVFYDVLGHWNYHFISYHLCQGFRKSDFFSPISYRNRKDAHLQKICFENHQKLHRTSFSSKLWYFITPLIRKPSTVDDMNFKIRANIPYPRFHSLITSNYLSENRRGDEHIIFIHLFSNVGSLDWRSDRRCGSSFPRNGKPGQCNPNGNEPCCSSIGYCGLSDAHCKCSGCTDYRKGEHLCTPPFYLTTFLFLSKSLWVWELFFLD